MSTLCIRVDIDNCTDCRFYACPIEYLVRINELLKRASEYSLSKGANYASGYNDDCDYFTSRPSPGSCPCRYDIRLIESTAKIAPTDCSDYSLQ